MNVRDLLYYILYNLLILPASISLHEYGHFIAAYCLGYYTGYATFSWAGGMFALREPLRSIIDGFVIGISGGLFAAFILMGLYFCMDWETDRVEKLVLIVYILHQLAYSILEGYANVGWLDWNLLAIISNILYPILLYGFLVYLAVKLHSEEKEDCR